MRDKVRVEKGKGGCVPSHAGGIGLAHRAWQSAVPARYFGRSDSAKKLTVLEVPENGHHTALHTSQKGRPPS
jgi:hypothetical protein